MTAATAGAEMAASGQFARSPLLTRIVTGVVLIAVAIGAVWQGGMVFTALAALAGLLMFGEWAVMFRLDRLLRLTGLAIIALSIFALTVAPLSEVIIGLGGGAGLAYLFARRYSRQSAFWLASGILYCGLPVIALLWLRGTFNGLQLTIWLLVCVWATDIGAFFIGRALGGPKLAPSISPAKTWSGAIGGVIVAALAGAGVLLWESFRGGVTLNMAQLALLSALLGGVAVLGDLLESRLKRLANVKDSGTLLPGHGGVLDRLDGLVPVACIGALIVLAKGWAG